MTVKVSPGDIYNRYTIIKQVDKGKNCRYFLCRCICGKEKEVRINHLRNGDIKSCGCYNLEEVRKSCFTHGMTQTRIYKIWNGIIKRCTNIEHDTYKNYGGRGIKCERSSFEEFYKDMKKGYSDKLSIDRIDNNGNYSKSNCRWATMKEQARNRSNNIYYNGKCLSQWCEELGLRYKTIYQKITRDGKSIEKALEIESLADEERDRFNYLYELNENI